MLKFPLTLLVTHVGGQINDSDKDLVSIANSSIGIELETSSKLDNISEINLSYKFFTFHDLSQSKNQFYSEGFGHLSKLNFVIGNFNLYSGYWYGYHFISSKGNPIYMSVSQRNNIYTRSKRSLLIPGINYLYHINSYSFLKIDFTSYYDTHRHDLDYSFLIKINVFLSKSLK